MRQFKAGTKVKQGSYYAFIPNPINRRLDFADPELSVLLSKADQAIGRLDAFADYVNTDLYISMHITKEAVESNRIEGTKTEFTEAFLTADSIEKGRQDDWEEVNNYIKAVHHATARLKNFPLSTRLIREAHGILLAGVRGQHKQPGSFRTSQNWIGGASIADATFIPPPAHALGSLLSDLEFFINSDEHPIPALLKAAILHYQFETIHPF
ncbi:MAG: Fic/DOC family N-terminal domain-containing protein, partial [Bacteroidota bacterium]